MVKGMTKTIRVSLLLVLLMGLGGFYFYSLGQRSAVPEANGSAPDAVPKPALASEVLSPMRQALRRNDFAALDAEFARLEKAAETDADAERALKHLLTDLGHGTSDDFRLIERWGESDSHYAQLALSRAHRIRGFHERGTDYANKIDPLRKAKFAEHNRASIAHGEQALKAHANCGLAYSQMIEALVGNSSRKEIDAMYQRALKHAPNWYSPAQSYSFALHPKWYGSYAERRQFIETFARRNPGHRAVPRLQAIEYVWQADAAINDRKYGEGMIHADHAIELDPGNSYAWLNKGRAFAGVQRAIEALAVMDKAVQLDPYNDSALRERAQLRLTMSQPAGQDDLVRAALIGDSWALNRPLWNHDSRGGDLFAGDATSENRWSGTPAPSDGSASIFATCRGDRLRRQ